MKLKEIIKSAKRIEVDLSMGIGCTAVKVTKKDAVRACAGYLDTEGIFDTSQLTLLGQRKILREWRNEDDEIIARVYSDGTLCIGV